MAAERIPKFLPSVVKNGPVPEHVAFIMDGNRRYAKVRGMMTSEGHQCGAESLNEILEFCFESGVKVATIYAFSIENFKRPKGEIEPVMALARQMFEQHSAHQGLINQYDLSVRALGRLEMLDDHTREAIMSVVDDSQHRTGGVINMCIAYTSRDEMTRSAREMVQCCLSTPASITSQLLSEKMDTANDPPLDLLVRTSGVTRLSDFLLYQCHQETDIQFVDKLWPEFKPWDLFLIISRWQKRKAAPERLGGQSGIRWREKVGYEPSSAYFHAVSIFVTILIILLSFN